MAIKFLYVTAPSSDVAETLAKDLLTEKLAACVNILPRMRSFYHWRGAIACDDECVLIVKTAAQAVQKAKERLLALHPYETPCIAALDINEAGSNETFVQWVQGDVSG